jgi:hypothetical protein
MTGLGIEHDVCEVDACEVRDLGAGAAMDAYQGAQVAAALRAEDGFDCRACSGGETRK